MAEPRIPTTGRCLCGAVRFEIRGRLSPITICHCSQCRRFHGAAGPYATCRRDAIAIAGEPLRWYRSSAEVQRGFCSACGSSLFWSREGAPLLAVAAGALDEPVGAQVSAHIFVASRASWERLEDGLPQHDAAPPEE